MKTNPAPWFLITGNYAFGHSIEATARGRIAEPGGTVAGSVKTHLGTSQVQPDEIDVRTCTITQDVDPGQHERAPIWE